MANVNIKFNNKDYILSCEDDQEDNLKELACHLDSKYEELKKKLGNIGENKLLLITSIKIVDEYFDLFKKVKHNKSDFEKLSIKFKELRSLAINYKEEKEVEIDRLKQQLDDFKTKVEKNKNSYEMILDKTTKSIEDFIEKTDSKTEKNIQ
jgi:cell division protein ZapA